MLNMSNSEVGGGVARLLSRICVKSIMTITCNRMKYNLEKHITYVKSMIIQRTLIIMTLFVTKDFAVKSNWLL